MMFSMCLYIMKFDRGFVTLLIDGVSRAVPGLAHLDGPTFEFIGNYAFGSDKCVLSTEGNHS